MIENVRAMVASGSVVVSSNSGGKDSTAMALFLKENDIPFQSIFCDTGWEHPETYRYLREVLPVHLGPIQWLRPECEWPVKLRLPLLRKDPTQTKDAIAAAETAAADALRPILEGAAQEIESLIGCRSAMVRLALTKAIFPARTLRWCTQELKFFPARDHFATLDNPINVVGIRHEESKARSAMLEWEFDTGLDVWVYRPLIRWTLADVVAIHARHGIKPNPLYLRNATRVGCFPCIFSRKEEIAMLDDMRQAAIRLLELWVARLNVMRRERSGQVVEKQSPTFFQAENALSDGSYHWPIDKVMDWARTGRGGRQYELFASGSRDAGCMRWGLCDVGANLEEP